MRTLRIFIAMALTVACARAADVKISDLTAKTAPSTNTFVEIADMSDTPKSGKMLFYDLLEDFLADSAHIDFSTVSGLRSGLIKATAEPSLARLFIEHELAMTNATASRVAIFGSTKQLTNGPVTATELASLSGNTGATGSGNLVLSASPTLTGTAALANSTNSGTALVAGAVGLGSTLTVAGASTLAATTHTSSSNSTTLLVAGAAGLGSTLNVAGAVTAPAAASFGTVSTPNVTISSNVTFTTADLAAASQTTNFVADFTFGGRTIDMTAAAWIVHATNHPAANNWKGWSAILRNNSGGALRVGVAAAFKRSGTNNVSVPNAARAKVVIEPDGTGGTDPTNFLAQIIVFDSP